jgi:hypothetical protein
MRHLIRRHHRGQAVTDNNTDPDINEPDDLLHGAWLVIANAAGWDEDSEWRRAAIRWRDEWFEAKA